MSLDKLKKFEQSLLHFRERYIDLKAERDVLLDEVKVLKVSNERLTSEKEDVRQRVESLLDIIKGLGL